MPYLKKQSRTQQLLKKALIQLMEKEQFEKISVEKIASAAGVTRSTLYRYYDDKYQILEEIENNAINALIGASKVSNEITTPTEVVEVILNGYQKQLPILHALFGPHGDPGFDIRLEHQLIKLFYKNHSAKNIEDELIQLANTAMWLRVLKYWIFNSDRITLSTIKDVVLRIMKANNIKIDTI